MNNTDKSRMVKLRVEKGLSYRNIAKILNKNRQTIYREIKKIIPNESVEIYKDHRADILANGQMRALANVTDTKLKKASARDLVVIAGVLYDKERLERGLSTANHSIHSILVDSSASGGPTEPPAIEAEKLPEPEPAPPKKKVIHRRKKT